MSEQPGTEDLPLRFRAEVLGDWVEEPQRELPPKIMAWVEKLRRDPGRDVVWIRPRQHSKSEGFITLEELQAKYPPANRDEYDRARRAATERGKDPE